MRVVLAALLLAPLPALAVVAPPAATCIGNDHVVPAVAPEDARRGFHRLDRLPPAAAEYLTVYRRIGACPAPVIVRHDVGKP